MQLQKITKKDSPTKFQSKLLYARTKRGGIIQMKPSTPPCALMLLPRVLYLLHPFLTPPSPLPCLPSDAKCLPTRHAVLQPFPVP
jgi:hypothetical protein